VSGVKHTRVGAPVLLVEQLAAWAMTRQGDSVDAVAGRLGRYPRETRAILWGRA
jgi:hypothetical protein